MLIGSCIRPVQPSKDPVSYDDTVFVAHEEPELELKKGEYPFIAIHEEDYASFRSVIFTALRNDHSSLFEEVEVFYAKNKNQTKWLRANAPDQVYDAYLELADEVWKEGLKASDYKFEELRQAVDAAYESGDLRSIAALDFQLTFSFFLLSHHLTYGKIRHDRVDPLWLANQRPSVFEADDLLSIADKKDLEAYLEEIRPKYPQYRRLKGKFEELTTWLAGMPEGAANVHLTGSLTVGDEDPQISRIRARLSFLDSTLLKAENPDLFDGQLHVAVKKFQETHGLQADGIIGPQTLAYLKKPVQEALDRIRINMERIRWMPRDFGNDYMMVNIPDFTLTFYESGKKKLDMKVIVGAVMNKTPIFTDTLEYIVFNPTWIIPQSIKVKEMLPRLQEDSACYSGRDYIFYKSWTSTEEVDPREIAWCDIDSTNFQYNIVQQPGPANALGRVKFIMPNDQMIYLHDTPQDHLFSEKDRDFSHGCIRLEKPMELARHLLDDQFLFAESKIRKLTSEDEPQQVELNKTYPVHIIYLSAWVDDKGLLQQREDVYQLDDIQLKLLKN